MNLREALLENEYEINREMVKFFRIMLVLIPIIPILKLVKVSLLDWKLTIILTLFMLLFSGFPILISKRNIKNQRLKYLFSFALTILSTVIYSIVYVNGIFFWMIPIVIATSYFNFKLIKFTFILSGLGLIIGESIASLRGEMFLAEFQWMHLHIIVFGIQFIFLYFLL